MISKQKIKFLRSLEHKKFRDIHNSFLAEGDKTISQLINHFSCEYLAATQSWLDANPHIAALAKETHHTQYGACSEGNNHVGWNVERLL